MADQDPPQEAPPVTKPKRTLSPEQKQKLLIQLAAAREAKRLKNANSIPERPAETPTAPMVYTPPQPSHPTPTPAQPSSATGMDGISFVPEPARPVHPPQQFDQYPPVQPPRLPSQSMAAAPPPTHPQRESLAARAQQRVQFNPVVEERQFSPEDAAHLQHTRTQLGRPLRTHPLPRSSAPAPSENSLGKLWNVASLGLKLAVFAFVAHLLYKQHFGQQDGGQSSDDQGEQRVSSSNSDMADANGERSRQDQLPGATLPVAAVTAAGGRGGLVNLAGQNQRGGTFLARNAARPGN